MDEKTAERGTLENPCSTLQEAYGLCDGTGKTIWLFNPNATLEFYELDEEDYEEEQ